MKINKNHPRYLSLITREKLVEGVARGITSQAGLIAHGRGEAFDYLLSEKTHSFAIEAIKAASAYLLLARSPIISVNGNTAILSGKELVLLSNILDCPIEVNLFHFSKSRVKKIENYLKKFGKSRVLNFHKGVKKVITGIHSHRAVVLRDGIGSSDCVFVPLEDGDRCEVLVKRGVKVITCDLNPMSRTAKNATVAIVDNITRSLPIMTDQTKIFKKKKREELKTIIKNYDNNKILDEALAKIRYDKFK